MTQKTVDEAIKIKDKIKETESILETLKTIVKNKIGEKRPDFCEFGIWNNHIKIPDIITEPIIIPILTGYYEKRLAELQTDFENLQILTEDSK